MRKNSAGAQPDSYRAEAAGLRWLAGARTGDPASALGARVVQVVDVDDSSIELELIRPARPTAEAALAFGSALATTHDAGAASFGAPPDGWDGPCFIGRQRLPSSRTPRPFGAFYAADRVLVYLDPAEERGHLSRAGARVARLACERIAAGAFDDDDKPSRLHGDLWNGNVLWSADGVVLIDPAAHGGHRETDLAMLALFGCPFLDEILAGYQARHPLNAGWQDRVPLHQLHPLAVHAASHGPSYGEALTDAAESVLALA